MIVLSTTDALALELHQERASRYTREANEKRGLAQIEAGKYLALLDKYGADPAKVAGIVNGPDHSSGYPEGTLIGYDGKALDAAPKGSEMADDGKVPAGTAEP